MLSKEAPMYGTVARIRIKPGMEARYLALERALEARQVPGFVALITYRLDAHPNEYYCAVVFESKDAYIANAANPAQDAVYRQLRELLAGDPDWHDGEIIYAYGLQEPTHR